MNPQLAACALIGIYFALTIISPRALTRPSLLVHKPRTLIALWLTSLGLACVSLLLGLGILIEGSLRHQIVRGTADDVWTPLIDSLLGWLAIATLGIITFRLGVAAQDVRHARRELHASLSPWLASAQTEILDGQKIWVFNSKVVVIVAVPSASLIAVSQAARERLSDVELGAVIAHEKSHLRRNHERLILIGNLMEALAPSLLAGSRLASSMRIATELIADDDAAQLFGAQVTAQALRLVYPDDPGVADRAMRLERRAEPLSTSPSRRNRRSAG